MSWGGVEGINDIQLDTMYAYFVISSLLLVDEGSTYLENLTEFYDNILDMKKIDKKNKWLVSLYECVYKQYKIAFQFETKVC